MRLRARAIDRVGVCVCVREREEDWRKREGVGVRC